MIGGQPMTLSNQTIRPTLAIMAIVIAVLLGFQGFSANAGTISDHQIDIGTPHAVTGYVYWPNGTVEAQVAIPVTVTNNRTGESGVVLVDVLPGGNPDGTYQIDLSNNAYFPSGYLISDVIYVNCTYLDMWAHNETLVGGGAFSICDLHMIYLLALEDIDATNGGTMNSFDGTFSLSVPPGALAQDTILYAVESGNPKANTLISMDMRPGGITFSSPSILEWSYASLNLGSMDEGSLVIFTYDGSWQMLSSTVDTVAKTVTAQVEHFSPFSMGSANAVGEQVPIPFVYPGQVKVPILNITLSNTDPIVDDTLQYFNVTSNGTDDNDVTNIHLWRDANSNYLLDAGDPQIGVDLPLTGGSANFTGLGENVPANTSVTLFAALDVSPVAVVGNLLDLYIPMYGIGMANAGISLQAIDPAGFTTINQDNLTDPHVVYGYINNSFGPVPSAWVNLTNNRTGITENLMSDSLGRYDVNIGLMPGGYLDADPIHVQANDTLAQSGWNTTIVDINNFGEHVDILLGAGPIASDETPLNGSTVADILVNITVNVTSTMPLNLTSILLEVNGTFFTVDGIIITWTNVTPTLTFFNFNTSASGMQWYQGQTVNVSLLFFNDTVGNTGQNAPYNWTFDVFVSLNPATGLWVEKDNADGSVAGDITLHWTDTNLGLMAYEVFASNDKFTFNFGAPTATTALGATSWTHVGANGDGQDWFYIVRPTGGVVNSTMGFKIVNTLVANNPATGVPDINFVGLPWNVSYYSSASRIVDDLEGAHGAGNNVTIKAVELFDPATQGMAASYYYSPGPFPPPDWYGVDWAITPGAGCAITMTPKVPGAAYSYDWVVNGTDVATSVTLVANDPATGVPDINFVGVPITGNYVTASSIVDDIEGGHGAGNNVTIKAVELFDPATQGMAASYYYSPGPFPPPDWYGVDWIVRPGAGCAITMTPKVPGVAYTYDWTITLLTPEI